MVLLVIALISMSFFAYKQRGMEVDKAEDLGYRLYEYGQAVGDYLRTEGKNFAHKPDDPTQLVYQGYQWLQELNNPDGKPYLNKDFSLVVEPLYVEAIPGEKTPLMTEFSVFLDPATNTYHLQLELITVGPVYSRNDFTTDEQGVRTSVQDVSLLARAVNYANEYRDTLKGSGVIQYQRVELGAAEPPAQPPPGTEPPGTEPPGTHPPTFTSLSIIQGALVDQSMWNDAWLLRSGQNTMQGPINFENNVDSTIANLTKMEFVSSGSSVSNLGTLNFVADGTSMISGLTTLNFANSNSSITGLTSLSFVGTGVIRNLSVLNFYTGGTVTGLKQITFQALDSAQTYYDVPFTGVKNIFISSVCDGTENGRNCDIQNPSDTSNFIYVNNYFCAVNRADDSMQNNHKICNLFIQGTGSSAYYKLHARSQSMKCSAICFQYN